MTAAKESKQHRAKAEMLHAQRSRLEEGARLVVTTDIMKHFLHHNRQNPKMCVNIQTAENLVHMTPLRSAKARTLALLGKWGPE